MAAPEGVSQPRFLCPGAGSAYTWAVKEELSWEAHRDLKVPEGTSEGTEEDPSEAVRS